jgi:hypothetical protein
MAEKSEFGGYGRHLRYCIDGVDVFPAHLAQRTRSERLLSNAQQPLALRLRAESLKENALFGNSVTEKP